MKDHSENVLQLLPENTTVTKTVDLSSLQGAQTDSQTIDISLSGNVLQLLPENTTVTKTVDLLTCRAQAQTVKQLTYHFLKCITITPENTTVTKTVDLSSLAGGSGTDSEQLTYHSLKCLLLLPENTTVTKTLDLTIFSNTDSQTITASLLYYSELLPRIQLSPKWQIYLHLITRSVQH